MEENRPIEVDFFGQKIPLKSNSDPDVIREAISLAEIKLRDAKSRGGSSTAPHHLALLALLELAEEYVRSKRRLRLHKQALVAKSEEVYRLVESQAQ